jgi:hypothetical protein
MTTDLTSGVAQFELLTDQRVVEPLPIITENLVLNLDAGNPLSYPGTGTTWTDLTTNGNNGTLINGPTFDSANGGSIVFDGTNDYINLGNILNFERTDEFSISTWINVSSLTNYGMILCKMDINQKGYFLYFEPTGAIGFCLRNTFNTNEILTFTQNTISLNNWVNICVTYNGNSLASGVIFYLNNINQTNTVSKDLLSASIINTSNNSIGSRINFNNGYVNGKISIVTVYNKELSATEVLQNFNATKNRYGL